MSRERDEGRAFQEKGTAGAKAKVVTAGQQGPAQQVSLFLCGWGRGLEGRGWKGWLRLGLESQGRALGFQLCQQERY